MASVAVAFQSGRGHSKVLADAIFKGIKAVEGTDAQFLEIHGSDVFEGRFARLNYPRCSSRARVCFSIVIRGSQTVRF
jgi:hypothetical protein